MNSFYKNLIIVLSIISLQTSIFSMDTSGTVPGRKVGGKFPLTLESLDIYGYNPTKNEIQFLHAVEKNALNEVKTLARHVNLARGDFFQVAFSIAVETNNKSMITLLKQLKENQLVARRIDD